MNLYRNVDYAYTVQLPRGLQIETSTPPNPNHGFRARVGVTSLWVSAHYETEGVSSLAEEVESVRARWRASGCRVEERTPATLGEMPAAELGIECPVRSARHPETLKVVLTLRTPPGHGPIVYQVGMRSPPVGSAGTEAERVFRTLIHGLSFTRE